MSFANDLRALADWYEAHPEIPEPRYQEIVISEVPETKDGALAVARAMGTCRKQYAENTFQIRKTFGGLSLCYVFWRATVCERRVTGVEEISEKIVPAHQREVVAWDCHPLLEASANGPS